MWFIWKIKLLPWSPRWWVCVHIALRVCPLLPSPAGLLPPAAAVLGAGDGWTEGSTRAWVGLSPPLIPFCPLPATGQSGPGPDLSSGPWAERPPGSSSRRLRCCKISSGPAAFTKGLPRTFHPLHTPPRVSESAGWGETGAGKGGEGGFEAGPEGVRTGSAAKEMGKFVWAARLPHSQSLGAGTRRSPCMFNEASLRCCRG